MNPSATPKPRSEFNFFVSFCCLQVQTTLPTQRQRQPRPVGPKRYCGKSSMERQTRGVTDAECIGGNIQNPSRFEDSITPDISTHPTSIPSRQLSRIMAGKKISASLLPLYEYFSSQVPSGLDSDACSTRIIPSCLFLVGVKFLRFCHDARLSSLLGCGRSPARPGFRVRGTAPSPRMRGTARIVCFDLGAGASRSMEVCQRQAGRDRR